MDGREFEEHSRFWFDALRRRECVRVSQVGKLRLRVELAKHAHEMIFQKQRLVRVGEPATLWTAAPGQGVVAPKEVTAGRRSELSGKAQRVGAHDFQGARR